MFGKLFKSKTEKESIPDPKLREMTIPEQAQITEQTILVWLKTYHPEYIHMLLFQMAYWLYINEIVNGLSLKEGLKRIDRDSGILKAYLKEADKAGYSELNMLRCNPATCNHY